MYLDSFVNGKTVLGYPPREVFIEPTNHCNLSCVMCPQSRGLKRKKGYMDMELYKKVIAEIKDFNLRRLNLFMSGESVLHPRLVEMIKIAKETDIYVRLHTNATLLSRRLTEEILSSGLDMLSFSFDGETKQRYESIRINANYEDVLGKIRYFLSEKKKLGARLPYVQIEVIKDYNPRIKQPYVEEKFKAFFKGLAVNKFKAIWFLSFGDYLINSKYKYPKGRFYEPCRQLWSRLAIGWDGRVFACCIDFDGENIIGDVEKDTVLTIWNGEKMSHLRQLMLDKKYSTSSLCRNCNIIWTDKDPANLRRVNNTFLRRSRRLLWKFCGYGNEKNIKK
jgi:radical SAM protein with 4Fe4S-binding SPASM domain